MNIVLITNTTMTTAKQTLTQLLSQLPDDCSIEDIQYHLYVLTKVHQGLEAAQKGTIPQAAAEQHLNKWLIK